MKHGPSMWDMYKGQAPSERGRRLLMLEHKGAMMCGRHRDVRSDSLLPRLMETWYLIKKMYWISLRLLHETLTVMCVPTGPLLHSQLTSTPGGRVAAAHCSLTGWMAHIWRRSFTSLWWCQWDFNLTLLTCRGFVATGDSIMLPKRSQRLRYVSKSQSAVSLRSTCWLFFIEIFFSVTNLL